MAKFKIQAPNGKVYSIEGPNDEQGAIKFLQQHLDTQRQQRSTPAQQGQNWWEIAPLVDQGGATQGSLGQRDPLEKYQQQDGMTLNIGGKRVKVDRNFMELSPEKQNATVDEIASQIGVAPQDGMTLDQKKAVALASARLRRQQQENPESGGYGSQVFSGLLEGATGALGAPVDLVNNFLVKPAVSGVNAVFGTDLKASETPLGGSAGLRQGLAISPESQNHGEQFARRVAQSVGGAAVPLAVTAQTAGQAAAGLATAAGGGMGGATAQQLFPNNAGAEIAGELLGGIGTGAAITGIANRQARKAAEAAVPTVEQLKQQAADKFQDAHSSGVMANQAQTQQLAADMKGIAEREGLISPTGRVSEAYPKAREALRMVEDYAQGDMSVPQMQTARKVLADAAKSSDDAERRISTLMLKQFDDFTSPLAPQLAEGRSLYARAMRGEELETLRELAGSRAGQFTGSGYENALRTEYRNLERRIIKGQERGWTPDQQAAISRVAQGTATSNALRNVGRMAPTGPVSYMSTVGAPGILGTMAGGPMLGATLATGSAMAGYGARAAATRQTNRFADLAEILVRNGVPINPSNNSELRRRVIEALIGSQSAAQSN